MSVLDKVNAKKYESKISYPSDENMPAELNHAVIAAEAALEEAKAIRKSWRTESRRKWQEDNNRLVDKFRVDLEDENEMTGHPKANSLWEKAWSDGHANGLSQVVMCYEDLVGLVK